VVSATTDKPAMTAVTVPFPPEQGGHWEETGRSGRPLSGPTRTFIPPGGTSENSDRPFSDPDPESCDLEDEV